MLSGEIDSAIGTLIAARPPESTEMSFGGSKQRAHDRLPTFPCHNATPREPAQGPTRPTPRTMSAASRWRPGGLHPSTLSLLGKFVRAAKAKFCEDVEYRATTARNKESSHYAANDIAG